jgi:glycerophosphoryl diester phosphodiesterase
LYVIPTIEAHGHRGARGLRPENTLPSFAHAIELGVDSLELDVALTADNAVVATHDPHISPFTCRDTAPHETGDPHFPYVGRPVTQLTLGRVKTLDCGMALPGGEPDKFAHTQVPVPGTRMPTLAEVCELLLRYGAATVRLTIELKTDPTGAHETPDPAELSARVAEILAAYDMTDRATVQSFDWRALWHAAVDMPSATRAALVDRSTSTAGTPWLAGLDPAEFGGDVVATAAESGAHRLAPDHAMVDADLVRAAHAREMPVIVWTVNDESCMHRMIEAGVDGVITDYPDRLRDVMAARGMPLPSRYPDPYLVSVSA